MTKQYRLLVGIVLLAMVVAIPLSAVAQTTTYVRAEPTESVKEVVMPAKKTNEQVVIELVEKYAEKYGVSSTSLMATLRNENDTFQFDRQSELRYKAGNRWGYPEGTREKSYGVAQIHLPDHPKISYEQATDPEFAIEFMAKMFAQGKQRMWMGYVKTLK